MSKGSAASFLSAVSRKLVEPSPRITDPELRHRAKVHSTLALVVLIGAVLASAAEEAEEGGSSQAEAARLVIWFGVLMLGAAYALSRTRHYTLSATLTVFTLSTLIWRLWAATVVQEPMTDVLYFVALPLILSVVLLPLAYTLVFILLTLGSVALIPAFSRSLGAPVPEGLVFNLSTFVLLVSALILAAAILLETSRRQLAEQAVLLEARTRETQEANEKLRQAESSRIQFLNQAAHDLANPLSPVKIQVELIRLTAEQHPELRVQDNVRMIQRNLGLFEHLLQDIRDLAKMDGGQLQLEKDTVRLHELATSVCDFYLPLAEEAGVRFDLVVPADIELTADPRRIQQVLNNLVANAIRFSPTWTAVAIEAQRRENEVEVSVADKGRGLTSDEISRLFRPFSQVHDRSEVKERGTGLGLYICKGFVEAHGGRIWAESNGRGHGSTFRFTLPTVPARGEGPP
jgi:signal transduction histidine kinase